MDEAVTSDEISIWCVALDATDALFEQRTAVLDNSERARARRFRRPRDGRRWSFARATLRHVLSHYVALRPEAIRFEFEGNGKPRLTDVNRPGFTGGSLV